MKYIPQYIFSLVFMLTLLGADAASAQMESSRDKTLTDFTGLHVYNGIQVILTQGDSPSAKVIADESLVDAVVVEQQGSNVNINWKPIKSSKKRWTNRTAKVYLTYKQLSLVESADGSSITTEGTLKGEKLEINVSSGAIIRAEVDCSEIYLKNNSGANALIKGKALRMDLDGSSGSNTNTIELDVQYAKVNGSSGANIRLMASKELQVIASSGSSIRYKGNAEVQNLSAGKSGMVTKLK